MHIKQSSVIFSLKSATAAICVACAPTVPCDAGLLLQIEAALQQVMVYCPSPVAQQLPAQFANMPMLLSASPSAGVQGIPSCELTPARWLVPRC